MSNVIPRRPGMTFEQGERANRYAYSWHVGKRRCSAFPTPRIDNKSTTEQISANWDFAERPRPRKTTLREDRFPLTSLDAIDFFLVES